MTVLVVQVSIIVMYRYHSLTLLQVDCMQVDAKKSVTPVSLLCITSKFLNASYMTT